MSWHAFGQWMMPRALDVEPFLARAFGSTGLLQGGVSDYLVALAIGLAFPLMRYLTDRHVYRVSRGACAPLLWLLLLWRCSCC